MKRATPYQFRINELVSDKNIGIRDKVGLLLNDLGFDCQQRQGVLLLSKTPRPTLEPTTTSSIGTLGSLAEDKGAEA
jgi:hypothetical protein